MTITAMVPDVRDTLGVDSSYDATVIPAGIRRSIRFLLRAFLFPQSMVKLSGVAFASGANTIPLPATGVGMISAVRVTQGGVSKRLRRTIIGELSSSGSPEKYWIEGSNIKLDGNTTAAGTADVWYHDTDVTSADPWITSDFEDIVFVHSCMKMAPVLRKPEVAAAFTQEWTDMVPTLAKYLNELQFNDYDVRMLPKVPSDLSPPTDRYGR